MGLKQQEEEAELGCEITAAWLGWWVSIVCEDLCLSPAEPRGNGRASGLSPALGRGGEEPHGGGKKSRYSREQTAQLQSAPNIAGLFCRGMDQASPAPVHGEVCCWGRRWGCSGGPGPALSPLPALADSLPVDSIRRNGADLAPLGALQPQHPEADPALTRAGCQLWSGVAVCRFLRCPRPFRGPQGHLNSLIYFISKIPKWGVTPLPPRCFLELLSLPSALL